MEVPFSSSPLDGPSDGEHWRRAQVHTNQKLTRLIFGIAPFGPRVFGRTGIGEMVPLPELRDIERNTRKNVGNPGPRNLFRISEMYPPLHSSTDKGWPSLHQCQYGSV